MSIKLLLQLVLVFLIVIILGGTYFLYFFKQDSIELTSKIDINKKEQTEENGIVEDLLEERNIEEINNTNGQKEQRKSKKNIQKERIFDENIDTKELLTGIEYTSEDKRGNRYKIHASYGKTNIDQNNLLDLTNVSGTITSMDNATIFIVSKYANYNYNNQETKFYVNVELKFQNKKIFCDNLIVNIDKNIVIAYDNVLVIDNNTKLKAGQILLDIITKDIKISPKDEKLISIYSN